MGSVARDAHISAARVAGEDPIMDRTAARVQATVLSMAAKHTKTGDYNAAVRTRSSRGAHGVRDRVVESTDPNALSIEYGHQWVTPEGKIIGYIKGLRIFNRAFNVLKRG